MTKTAILTLALYCGAEFLAGFTGALTAAIIAAESGTLPNWTAIVFAILTGLSATVKTLLPVLRAMLVDFGLKMGGEDTSAVVKAASKVG